MGSITDFISIGQLTASGLLLLVALLFFLGRVIPKSTVDALLAARDAEIARCRDTSTEWRSAYELERHARELVTEQNGELIEVARTVEHIMESLREAVGGQGHAGQ